MLPTTFIKKLFSLLFCPRTLLSQRKSDRSNLQLDPILLKQKQDPPRQRQTSQQQWPETGWNGHYWNKKHEWYYTIVSISTAEYATLGSFISFRPTLVGIPWWRGPQERKGRFKTPNKHELNNWNARIYNLSYESIISCRVLKLFNFGERWIYNDYNKLKGHETLSRTELMLWNLIKNYLWVQFEANWR